jgi:hypothetical protein
MRKFTKMYFDHWFLLHDSQLLQNQHRLKGYLNESFDALFCTHIMHYFDELLCEVRKV